MPRQRRNAFPGPNYGRNYINDNQIVPYRPRSIIPSDTLPLYDGRYTDMYPNYDDMPDLEDNPDYYTPLPRRETRLSTREQNQISQEAADMLTLGRNAGREVSKYLSNRDNSDEYLRDPQTGRYLVRYKRGDPSDPNYFWDPYNRPTTERVRNTTLNDIYYNQLGIRNNARPEPEPLNIRQEMFDVPELEDWPELPEEPPERSDYGVVQREPKNLPPRLPPGPPRERNNAFGGMILDSGTHSNVLRPVNQDSQGVLKFSSSEFICNIGAPGGAFSYTKFSVNPALYSTFSVLSQIASCFVFYRFTKLKFIYISTSADSMSTTNNALGSICMAHLENVAASDPVTFGQIMNYPGAKSFKPSLPEVEYEIDCTQRITNAYFCRVNPTVVDGQIQLSDMFNFFIATNGFQFAYTCGELHVEYDVELWDPFLNGTLRGNQCLYYRCKFGIANQPTSVGMASTGAIDGHGNMGCDLTSGDDGQFFRLRFPAYVTAGIFHVSFSLSANGTAAAWGHNGANGPTMPNIPFSTIGIGGVQFLGMDFVSPVSSTAWDGHGGSAIAEKDVEVIYTAINTIAAGQPYLFYMPSYSATDWSQGITVSFYVKVDYTVRTGSYIGNYGAQMAVAQADDSLGNLYAGSLSVEQVNPNYEYPWSTGGGVDLP